MGETTRDPYRVSLSVSAEQVRCGQSVMLQWKAIGVESTVASMHLTTGVEDRITMIESVVSQGGREVIFEQTGLFVFCLTVTFGDGTKCMRESAVVVE